MNAGKNVLKELDTEYREAVSYVCKSIISYSKLGTIKRYKKTRFSAFIIKAWWPVTTLYLLKYPMFITYPGNAPESYTSLGKTGFQSSAVYVCNDLKIRQTLEDYLHF